MEEELKNVTNNLKSLEAQADKVSVANLSKSRDSDFTKSNISMEVEHIIHQQSSALRCQMFRW